jgi:hypothetical protein
LKVQTTTRLHLRYDALQVEIAVGVTDPPREGLPLCAEEGHAREATGLPRDVVVERAGLAGEVWEAGEDR